MKTLPLLIGFMLSFWMPPYVAGQAVTVWTPESWELLSDDTPPVDGVPHLRMVGGRNGWASGVIAARGPGVFSRPLVEVSDLRHESGAVFPSRMITVRYASQHHRDAIGERNPSREGDYFHLSTTPLRETRTLVARVTAEIPAGAPPGAYRGQAVVSANGRHIVPVTLLVGEGVIPSPEQYVSHVNYPHSPDSVALRYGVDMWSREHWEKLDASFNVFRLLGQNVVHVPVILHSETREGNRSNPNHFGSRQGMIRFQRQGNRVVPDFSVFESFLARWSDRVSPPQFIVLYVWDISFANHERDHFEGLQAVVTEVDARGNTSELLVPYPGTPGSESLWNAVIQGARERVVRLGWDPEKLLIGIAHDRKPENQVISFYNEIAPGIHWNVISHMRGYGIRDGAMTIGEMRVAYHEFPWNPDPKNMRPGQLLGGWNPDFPVATISRFHSMQSENALSHRWLGDGTVGSRGTRNRTTNIGPTRWLIEFWPVPQTDRRGNETLRWLFNMSGWVNLIRNRTVLGTAGPNGLEPSVYLMNNIESIQDTEARIAIEQMLRDPEVRETIPEDLVARAYNLIVERGTFIVERRSANWSMPDTFNMNAHSFELYNILGAMQRASGNGFN